MNETSPCAVVAREATPWHKLPLSELRSRRSTVLGAVVVCLFVDMVVYGVVVPVLPKKITEDLGMDATDVGILFSCYSIGLLSITPVIGYLSDKFHNRQIPMLFGLLGLGFSTIVFSLAESYWVLVVARIAQGISGGISWTIGLCVVADMYQPAILGEKMSQALSANTVGLLVGPPLGGILYGSVGYMAPFLFCAVLAFLDFAVWAWVKIPTEHDIELLLASEHATSGKSEEILLDDMSPKRPAEGTDGITVDTLQNARALKRTSSRISVTAPINRLSTTASAMSEAVSVNFEDSDLLTSPSKLPVRSLSMPALIRRPQILLTLLSIFMTACAVAGLEPIVPLFLETSFELSSAAVGIIYGGSVLPSVAGSLIVGPISDKHGRKNIASFALVACSVASLASLALCSSVAGSVLFLVLFSVSTSASLTPTLPELGEMVLELGGGANAQIYALFNIAYGLGMTVGPLLTTAVYQSTSDDELNPRKGFTTSVLVLGLLLFLWSPVMLMAYFRQKAKGSLL